jgi:hypothetical protein
MRYTWLSAFSFLTAMVFATPAIVPWDDMRVKHTWHAVPADWESQGHPSAVTVIDLHIALKPERESALIDTLYEVSDPRHPKCVISPLLRSSFYSRAPLQIWRVPFQGRGC